MQGACEAASVLALLEGGAGGARAAAEQLAALYGAVREPWLTRALLAYHARTESARALDLLARAPDTHARHLLDALHEQLRGERAQRRLALAAMAPLVARRPAWLRLVPAHPVARELLRAARLEPEPPPQLHALLALAALVPAAPALAAAHAPDLAEAVVRAASGSPHAALAARALFRALYATHPCTALEALRAAGASERCARALSAGVRLHPALVTGSVAREADAARWARVEPHDVLAECRRLSLPARDSPAPAPPSPPPPPPPPPPQAHTPPPGSTAQVALSVRALRPGGEGWWSLGEVSGAEAAPHTPLPADEPEPEPERAVEATPENTPRPAARHPGEGGAGAGAGAVGARLARVAAERRALHSPVPLGPDSPEDREVRDLTRRRPPTPPDWADVDPVAVAPRATRPARPRPRAAPARAPRRAASAPPRPAARRAHAAVQTVDTWPEPYEFLLADWHRASPPHHDHDHHASEWSLDTYLAELYSGRGGAGAGAGAGAGRDELAEQLALAHAHLMYERWRREAHAERNRRLLGRCRHVRALELTNGALQERVRALTRERDALRACHHAAPLAPPGPGAGPGGDEAERARDEALRAERGARLRAEAARHEAEAARARDQAELQRTRAESFEAARHVEALARAALAAERRAEHVRRLRRELLVLAERETRLATACSARAPAPLAPGEAALRAAAARAEAEAAAASARAEAAHGRAAELEAALAARDAAVADLKRATRHAAEEGEARTRALRDKYAALLCVVRAREAHRLERLAAHTPPTPTPTPTPTADTRG